MAHHFEVPMAFDFAPGRQKWRAFHFVPLCERGELAPSPYPLRFDADDKFDLQILRDASAPHPYLASKHSFGALAEDEQAMLRTVVQLLIAGEAVPESLSTLIVSDLPPTASERKMDAWAMRDDFMNLEESNLALVGFLNRWGAWGESSYLRYASVPFRRYSINPLEKPPTFLFPYLVWKRRRGFREGMLGKPATWLSGSASLEAIHRRPRFPYLGVSSETCAGAIETTITIDHLRNVEHRICARVDCDRIFSVDSDHGKIYCEQYCGHLVSVRRKRAAVKEAAKTSKRKKA